MTATATSTSVAAPGATRPASERPATTVRARADATYRRARSWVQAEAFLVALLVSSFVARWLLADRNSYWEDELYSVALFGRWNDGALAAVDNLAENSVHPPLYQFVLYYWMDVFGDSEVATRSLSNLYVTLATLCLYLLLRDTFSRRVALASAVTFCLMNLPLYYALETRSYAQTLLLVAFSSYLLLRIVRSSGGWRAAVRSPSAVLFMCVNVALLLTHYYNLFFLAAQATVVAVYTLRAGLRWRGLLVVAGAYLVQLAVFAAIWGRVFVGDFRRRREDFTVEDDVLGVSELLADWVVTPNIDAPAPVWWVGLACVAVLLVRSLVTAARRGPLTGEGQRAWTVVYLFAWLVLPLALVYTGFSLADVERYNMRYFLFCTVALAPLVVLTVEEAGALLGRAWRRLRGRQLSAEAAVAVTVATLVAAMAAFIVPGTYSAATAYKADVRGNVQRVVDVIREDPGNDYIVLEASYLRTSVTNFYFERYSDDARVHDVIARRDDRAGDGTHPVLVDDEPVVALHDYLIVLFPHLVTGDFPNALEELDARYDVHHRQIDGDGHGFIIYDVQPSAS